MVLSGQQKLFKLPARKVLTGCIQQPRILRLPTKQKLICKSRPLPVEMIEVSRRRHRLVPQQLFNQHLNNRQHPSSDPVTAPTNPTLANPTSSHNTQDDRPKTELHTLA